MKFVKKVLMSVVVGAMLVTNIFSSVAVAKVDKSEIQLPKEIKDKGVKAVKIKDSNDENIIKITSKNGKAVYLTTKRGKATTSTYDINTDVDFYNSLTEEQKEQLNSPTKEKKVITKQRTYIAFSDSEAEANAELAKMREQVTANEKSIGTSGFQSMSRYSFFHGSYIEDYSSWAGHGYHLYFSARDASYITNMGWVASDALAGALVALGIFSAGVGVVLGAVATAGILTTYWIEQNSDGSLDIWSPDLFRPSYLPLPGASLGTIKIGSHWYPIVMP